MYIFQSSVHSSQLVPGAWMLKSIKVVDRSSVSSKPTKIHSCIFGSI